MFEGVSGSKWKTRSCASFPAIPTCRSRTMQVTAYYDILFPRVLIGCAGVRAGQWQSPLFFCF
jgi:hypothetical protein